MHNSMIIVTGWFPFYFTRGTAPLILYMATHCHTIESVRKELIYQFLVQPVKVWQNNFLRWPYKFLIIFVDRLNL